ncbi:MAG TPA: EAL domain-containing protein [Macromonas sp.]|nr:EAL domain-containing protein [Macromonas sp.]
MNYIHWQPCIEGMLEGVWVVDPKTQRILTANAAAAELQGLKPADVIGASAIELSASIEDTHLWQEVAAGYLDGLRSDALLRRADGSTVVVDRMLTVVTLDDGRTVCLVGMQDKSQQHHTEQQLERLLAELRATLESTADAILVCDMKGKIRAFNRLFAELWQLPEELLTQHNDEAIFAFLASSVPNTEHYQERLHGIQRNPLLEATDVLVLRCGRVLERIARPQLARGRPIGRVYAFRDITQRTATEAQLQLAAKVFESSPDAIIVTDAQQQIEACNPATLQLTQCSATALQGRSARELFYHPGNPTGWLGELDQKLLNPGYWEGELWFRRPDGQAVALQASWVVLRSADGAAMHTVLFAKDLTDKLEAQRRIEQLAYTDALTGLPNRLMLTERVTHAIHLSQRSDKGFAILFLDLDRFKHINDSLGHLFGDRVLVEIANRLKDCLRQTDTLCRLGGDEFVIHLHDADPPGAELTARRIIDTVAAPVSIDDMHFSLSCSLGIAMYPTDGSDMTGLIQHADTAMYQVKERGKGHYRFYQPQMNADLLSRIRLDHAMREGLKRNEFVLHYQPRLGIEDNRILGCEALVRWHHPENGLLMPGAFIGVAEDTGFIIHLGQWVLREAVRQAAQWASLGQPCQVAVNVSALQFQQTRFVEDVAAALQEQGLDPGLLELELTESILIQDAEEALEKLKRLADLGVAMSIDDFGTGYSSMAYLKRFPLHKLKIDRSFIMTLHEQELDAAIVLAIIQMGHALKLQVVAEGVELQEQLSELQRLGCDQYQGFLFAKALPSDAFVRLLANPAPQNA